MTTTAVQCDMVILKNVMVPMRDGVQLATDVYLPADGTQPRAGLPAILARTSYDKSLISWVDPTWYIPRGYAVVIQDLRGRGQSEGTGQYFHSANPTEGRDGYDTVEWVAGQSWCSGKVGMVGSSHGGMTQTAAALHRPPHLTALWPDVGPTNIYRDTAREGGAMALMTFSNLFLHGHDAQELRDDPTSRALLWDGMEHLWDWLQAAPYRPGQTPLRVAPGIEQVMFDYYYRGTYDDWWAMDCTDFERHYPQHADVPSTITSGWYDSFPGSASRYYVAMAAKNATPQRLIRGPWNHGAMRAGKQGTTVIGDVDFGPEARWGMERYDTERTRWFDRWLKGIENQVESEAPVRIFVMGGGGGRKTAAGRMFHGGQFRSEQEWPLARTQFTPFYLRANGGLTPEQPDKGDAAAHFTFDPRHPVPTLGGSTAGFFEMVPLGSGMNGNFVHPRGRMRCIMVEGPMHQRETPEVRWCSAPFLPLANRPDVLVFQTEPLATDVEVTGPLEVKLWISSSAVDTDFTAKLIDVYPPNPDYPDGYQMNLSDSIIRTRFRNSWEREELMKPGEVYPVRIELPPTSNLFKAGHRIRLDVSSSNFPRLELNPNTGEPVGRHTHTVVAQNTVYLDRSRPSHVVLPIIPTVG